ncbi:molybdopterin converting factor, subunit 2 [Luminiphilus syltensis NOR5-1B]|uniref:Molybdopterin synthase catalytic subunit n=1 Tax=Luminiphilus syltensis NOR5-1B TaxID=565045 RepID=B8KRP1_9GAMM|nr:molybdenum cofactor biosynthesis protein MoaE [Luminiphilus syltensis]EED36887.1 molybdopterin converting factor, subunit 2 [Luminiphilus syltensis NOR5-1B]
MGVFVQRERFDVAAAYRDLLSAHPGAAVVTFTGYVRDFGQGGAVNALELEHYPGMAERVLYELGQSASSRFGLRGWQLIHRYGKLGTGEPIVWVGTVADHRTAAFDSCNFIMDVLKTDAPFWKREHSGGQSHWVEANGDDAKRRRQWRGR